VQRHQAARFEVGRYVGYFVLNRLKRPDRPAKLNPLGRVTHRHRVRLSADAYQIPALEDHRFSPAVFEKLSPEQ